MIQNMYCPQNTNRPQGSPGIDVFETALGWFGVLAFEATICRLKFGYESRNEAVEALGGGQSVPMINTGQPWRHRLQSYSTGDVVSFTDLKLDTDWMSPFQKSVIDACRCIPFGSTVTYGQLAQAAGSPGAARAVGTIMRNNRFPIIVPCHRVVAAAGLGGFSAMGGVDTKRRLLEMENAIPALNQPGLFEQTPVS
jgi:methylated-DNA-[protein]-cysteine S-methyltransferase